MSDSTCIHKNGTQAIVIDEYSRTTDNKSMVTVRRLSSNTVAHWPAARVTICD